MVDTSEMLLEIAFTLLLQYARRKNNLILLIETNQTFIKSTIIKPVGGINLS